MAGQKPSDVFNRVEEVLRNSLGLMHYGNADDVEITPTSLIVEDLGAESLDFVVIEQNIRKEFGIQTIIFPDDTTDISVGWLCEHITDN